MYERKYEVNSKGQIVKRDNKVPIPDDEPIFIIRGKDRKALPTLVAYNAILDYLDQKESVTKSIEDFRTFQEQHPERMAEPRP